MYIEIVGAILAIAYLILEIKRNWLMWLVGIISSSFYVYIFFKSALYAEMGLNVFYIFMSFYGIYCWKFLKVQNETELPIKHITKPQILILSLITIVAFTGIKLILSKYTNSEVPYMDAAIAALSITATWMTARKIIEHWFVWIFTNAISIGLYLYLAMYPTSILFIVYTIMAIIGFSEWNKSFKIQQCK